MSEQTATFSEFARIAGFRRSYITQLRKDDRLVLEGRRVLVEPSLARIAETSDPAKHGVATRHAVGRMDGEPATPASDESPGPELESGSEREVATEPHVDGSYQHWRARNERAKALAAERDNQVAEGRLLDATDVSHAVAGTITTLRVRLESLPSMLAPQVAGMDDEAAIRVVMSESIEHALTECARSLHLLGSEAAS